MSPLGRSGLLAGKVLSALAVLAVQVLALGALALALGWRPVLGLLPALITLVLGAGAFVALALLLAGTGAEAVLALANLVWVLFSVPRIVTMQRVCLSTTAEGVYQGHDPRAN